MTASARSPLPPAAIHAFLARVEPSAGIAQLFGYLPGTNFFAKDAAGHFVLVDEGFVAMLGRTHRDEILGRTDFDFFPNDVAEKYVRDDRRVMQTGKPVRDLIEAVPDDDLTFSWRVVNKVPLRDRTSAIVGVAGITSELSSHHPPESSGEGLVRVLHIMGRDFRSRLTVAELARQAGVSVRSLERTFLRTFQTTPLRYLNRVRLQAARHALLHSGRNLATIAIECGFYDQSHMTTQFTRLYGQSPSRYRRTHRAG